MNLEQQVVSLELAKKLKELGVKQESLFWWVNWQAERHPNGPLSWHIENHPHDNCESIAAFTVAELGEMLPPNITSEKCTENPFGAYCSISFDRSKKLGSPGWEVKRSYADTEADARAKMLCYLLENNKLLTLAYGAA